MVKSSQKEILVGINLHSELKFEDHVNFMCNKPSQKFYALTRIAPFMELKQRRNIMKAFAEYQFGYCPLIWMFHIRGLNNKIKRIHERALRMRNKGKSSTFHELLEKDNFVSNQHRNVQKAFYRNLKSIFAPVSRPYNFR